MNNHWLITLPGYFFSYPFKNWYTKKNNPSFKKYPLLTITILLLQLAAPIKIVAQINAAFTSDIIDGCAPIVVKFTDQSTGGPTQWSWDLGNGTQSSLQHPSASYFTPGVYTVKLLVKNASQQDSLVKTGYIIVHQSPSVNFTAPVTSGCTPVTVAFNDASQSDVPINSWQWDFGDGVITNEQAPQHTYTLPGNYSVTLKIVNSNGCAATIRKAEFIKNNYTKASFTSNRFSNCTPNQLSFNNSSSSSGSITNTWYFGDGSSSTDSTPVHTYNSTGTYAVKLVVKSSQGCTDSITQNVSVQLPVSANFTSSKQASCTTPFSVSFFNQHEAGNTYKWYVNDSLMATTANPVYEFTDTGYYDIKLVVRDKNGCVDSLIRYQYIKVQTPYIVRTNLPDSGCLPFTKTFEAELASADSVATYLWLLGDGTTSTARKPTHRYNNPGYYDVTLQVTFAGGCRDTISIPNAIRVNTKPTANFSAAPLSACAGTKISFTNLSVNAQSWMWDFGDDIISLDKNPEHDYKDTGWMTVSLIAMNGGCTDTVVHTNYIYIKPAVANFSIQLNCKQPFVRTFKNNSIGATRFLWTFGDGDTSTAINPTHTYLAEGDYIVTLHAWNDSTGCSNSNSKTVKIFTVKPDFFASDTAICRKDTINLISPLTNTQIARFSWTFGDNTSASTRSNKIAHIYTDPGVYTVRLVTLSTLNCYDTLTKNMYITVNGPYAKFGVPAPVSCSASPVVFTDSSTTSGGNAISNWSWQYGDGTRDSVAAGPFTHTYSQRGTYSISLKVTDTKGCTDTFTNPVRIRIVKVTANFWTTDSVVCPGTPVKFICPYAEQGIIYRWHFGDGATANIQFPSHQYTTEGIYTASLVIIDPSGCQDSFTLVKAVRVVQTQAHFAMSDSFKTCPPLLIQFTNQSGNAVSQYWDFGDSSYTDAHNPSHFYTYPGVYTATLYAKGPGGCVSTMQKQVVVNGPKGNLQYGPLKLCAPYRAGFTVKAVDAVSYIWDYNDGVTQQNTDTATTHTYQQSGNYVPKIILVDAVGCRVPVTGKDTITNIYVTPAFNFTDSIVCDRGSVQFNNISSSNDSIIAQQWSFGDNGASVLKNPAHQYSTNGIYYPTLSITTQQGCTAQYQSAKPLKVASSPGISITKSANGCVPLQVSVQAIKTVADSSTIQWHWNMGNGNTAVGQNPLAQWYYNPGLHTITLTGNSSNGCSTIVKSIVDAFALPVFNNTPDTTTCRGQQFTLRASGAARYAWAPAATLNCDTCANTIANPINNTSYILTGTSAQGCVKKDTIDILVKQPFTIQYTQPDKLCAGKNKQLTASGAHQYQWWPANGLSNPLIANPVAQPDSTTNYMVVGTDDKGCFRDTGFVKLTVYPIPKVEAGADKTITVGMPVDLDAVITTDVTEVNWTPTSGIFRNSLTGFTAKPDQNTEYTVEVKNKGGCSARDRVTVFVTCNGTNVFVPNLFSPNDDGVNDVFYPRGVGLFKIKSMKIFNRWGEPVFEKSSFNANDPGAGWDGRYKGSKLNTDVFVYNIELICNNNSVLALNGNISLVR